jgi:hypothetical protein
MQGSGGSGPPDDELVVVLPADVVVAADELCVPELTLVLVTVVTPGAPPEPPPAPLVEPLGLEAFEPQPTVTRTQAKSPACTWRRFNRHLIGAPNMAHQV